MDRVRYFTDSELSPDEKSGIRLLVSKKVLDPTVWTLDNFTNEELLKVCKDALKEQQAQDASVDLLEGKFTRLKINKGCASSFTASNCRIAENCGFTATFPVPFMRPKIVIDILGTDIFEHDMNIAEQTLRNALTIGLLPHTIHETNLSNDFELCVESIAGEALSGYLSFQTTADIRYKSQVYLSKMYSRGLIHVNGVASDNSYSDGIVYSAIGAHKIGTGVPELKDRSFAPGPIVCYSFQFIVGSIEVRSLQRAVLCGRDVHQWPVISVWICHTIASCISSTSSHITCD